nr:ferritin-like fold-containing protein [Pseudoclavibacter sp. 13-3]
MKPVFKLFRRRQKGTELRVRSRSESAHTSRPTNVRIDFLAPDSEVLVGTLAYFKLSAFEYLTGVLPLIEQPDLRAQTAVVAEELLIRHRHYRGAFGQGDSELTFGGVQVHQADSDELWSRLSPNLWQEAVLAVYLVDGFADDFVARLGRGAKLRTGLRWPVAERPDADAALSVLAQEIERTDWLADRLAMWGRRLVGDSLLWCRALMVLPDPVLRALRDTSLHRDDEVQQVISQIEAVHADLIAGHTARMERLGLTA